MKKFASLILIVAPLMEAYYFPGTNINLWKIVLILICTYIILRYPLKSNFNIKWPHYFKAYFLFGIFSSILGALYYHASSIIFSSLIVNIIYVAALILIVPKASIYYCKKYYGITVSIACIVFILQEILYHSTGYRFSGIIPFLDVPYDTTTADFMTSQMTRSRSTSIFLEPAHFAQYCAGYLAILLGENCRKRNLFTLRPILLSIILFFTVSGNAVLLTLIAWLVFFILYFKKTLVRLIAFVPVIALAGIFLFNYVSQTEQGERLLDRTDELEYNSSDRISSGTMRIYRGYFVFGDMPLLLKIIGAGTAGTDNAIENSQHSWMFGNEKYINNIQKIIVGTGAIGFILFVLYCYNQIKLTTDEGKILMILFIVISIIEYCWLFPKMLIFCGLAWLYQLKKQSSSNKIKILITE